MTDTTKLYAAVLHVITAHLTETTKADFVLADEE